MGAPASGATPGPAPVEIRVFAPGADLTASVAVIRAAFAPVAAEFGLTPENCAHNAAFITGEKMEELRAKGAVCIGLFEGGAQVGFVAVERATGEAGAAGGWFLERLAVLPEKRHLGYGTRLLDAAFDYVRARGGTKVLLGMIDRHTVLKRWYEACGFTATGTKDYPHLPFTVGFMEKPV